MGNTSETDIFNEIHKEQQERQNLLDRREKHSKKRKEEQQKQKREQLEESIKNKPYYQFTDQEKEYYIITHRELFSHTSDEKGTLGLFITDINGEKAQNTRTVHVYLRKDREDKLPCGFFVSSFQAIKE